MIKLIAPLVLLLLIVAGFFAWRGGYFESKKDQASKPITLTIWGLWEDESLIKPAIINFQTQYPHVTIKYVRQNLLNYRTRVQTTITEGEAQPDIFLMHNTWLPMFQNSNLLSALPLTVMGPSEYKQSFYPVVAESFTKNSIVYAFPAGVDGLALYYNENMLKNNNITVPKNWVELQEAARRLTKRDAANKIQIAGVSMGSTQNVDHWSDLVGLLYLQQPEAEIEKPSKIADSNPNIYPAAEVFRFYVSFITDSRKATWSKDLERALEAFTEGKSAFYFGLASDANLIKSKNPNFQFKTSPVPQIPDSKKTVTWANFWGFAVSNASPNQQSAWEFLKFITNEQNQKASFQEAARLGTFGLPYSRVSMQKDLETDPVMGSFVSQAPYYKFWYLANGTMDQGINDDMIEHFKTVVDLTLDGKDPVKSLDATQKGVNQVLNKYLNPPASPAKK